MLITGSILLGTAAVISLKSLGIEGWRPWLVGAAVCLGVYCVGLAMREAFTL